MRINQSEYQVAELSNGLPLISCPMAGMESVAVGIWAGIGGRYETKDLQGISHFVEHLLFKGSRKRSGKQISRAIEGIGGQLNAYTSEEFTCYLVKVRGKHLALALDVLWDMVLHPLFKAEDIAKERLVIKEELHMILDHPGHYVHEIVQEMMWPEHPLGRMLIGTEKSLADIGRRELKAFQRQNYFPANMLVSAAGNLDVAELIRKADEYTKGMAGYSKPRFKKYTGSQRSPKVKMVKQPTNQIHICLGLRTIPRNHPDRYAVKLLSTILGENMSSRLFQQIREKHGLAYDISSSVSYFRDTGGLVISGGIKPRQGRKFTQLVLRELSRLKEKAVRDAELNRAKEFYQGQLALGFEKTTSRMLWLGENLLTTGKIPTVEEVYNEVQRVTPDDIRRLAEKIFVSNNLNCAIVGAADEEIKVEL